MSRLAEIELDQIVVEDRIRKMFDDDSIKELAASIEQHGILQPITVEANRDGTYKLLFGERRFMAARRVGMNAVPVIILENKLDPEESLEARLIENLHRQQLDPLDEAEAYQQLIDMGHNVSEVARRVGKSRYYVSKRLRLLGLHPKLRQHVRRRTLTPAHAQALLRLESQQQLALGQDIVENGLTEKEARERVRRMLGRQLSWRLVPIRLSLEEYRALEKVAPEGDVEAFIRQAVETIMQNEWNKKRTV